MARRKHRSANRTSGADRDLPDEFIGSIGDLLGDELPLFRQALEEPSPVSIRLHPIKGFDPGGEQVPWCSTGRYLEERPSFTFDPLLHAGAYYVQEASSMFLERALHASGMLDRDVLALDMSAAPGGKSTHLRSLLSPGSLLVANEIDRRRQASLKENLWKWGYPNVIITGSAPADFAGLPDQFDLIVVDAPCSGEGMFQKDPFARQQWDRQLVMQCALLQENILSHAWNSLVPGGVLIYSTCTWEIAENDLQLKRLINNGAIPMEILLNDVPGIVRSEEHGAIGYRFYPHRVKGEGLFMGLVKKPGHSTDQRVSSRVANASDPLPFLHDQEQLQIIEKDGIQHALDDSWATRTKEIRRVLRTLAPGIPVAERKGAEWRPHPALALNRLVNTSDLQLIDLELAQAISYLKGEVLRAQGARGPALATHRGLPLGWLHGAGDRWNNRWPVPWRIRSREATAPEVSWAQHVK